MTWRGLAAVTIGLLLLSACTPDAGPAARSGTGTADPCSLFACSAGPAPSAVPTDATVDTSPPSFVSGPGSTTCPTSELTIGSDPTHWLGLANCSGDVAHTDPDMPIWQARVGVPQYLTSDLGSDWTVSADPADVARITGHMILPLRAGAVVLSVQGLPCDGNGGRTCTVVRMEVRP